MRGTPTITQAAPATGPERARAPTGDAPLGSARRIARNSLVPFAAGLGARALSWAMAAAMARALGPAGSGAYAFAVNLWLYGSIVADFGLGTWLTREVARSPRAGPAALRESLGLRLALAAAAAPALTGIAAAYAGAGQVDWAVVATVALLGLGLLPGAVSAAGAALFNAHELMVFPAYVQLGSALLTTAAGVALLLAGHGIVALGWVSLGVNVATAAVFAAACARRFFPLGAAFRPARQFALARETLPLMVNGLLNNVFFRVDVQILQSRGSAVVGYYTSAYKIIDAAGAVPSSFVLALFPLLSRRAAGAGGQAGDLGRVYRLALKLLVATALPLAVLITFSARELTAWLWGPAFLPDSAIALSILIWFLPLSFFNGLTQYVLIALGLQRRITPAFALTAAFNVAANMLLIPRFSYVAAAAVTITSEVVLLVPFLLAVRERVAVGPLLLAALRPVPAAGGMGLILWGLAAWPAAGTVLLAAASYPLLLVATRVFDPAEWRVLLGLLPGRLRYAPWQRRAAS